MSASADPDRPDLTSGVTAASIADGRAIVGRVGDEDVLIARTGDQFFAVGAHCTHYHGDLADGLIADGTVRCPLHHACFSLRTGEALRAPALDPITCWRVERKGDLVFVREKAAAPSAKHAPLVAATSSVVVVGGGAAALAAADMLRREGFEGPITMISAETDPPVDRPNLSKDYLAGEAQDDWIPMWPPATYADRRVELLLDTRVTAIDTRGRTIELADGSRRRYGVLLLATGADPVKLPIPGADDPAVMYLRSFADSRAIVDRAKNAKHAVVVGASFIGLEVSAALRTRGIAVDVVAPESVPLERVMGLELGRFVQDLHEAHGVVFHLGQTVTSVAGRTVALSGGTTLDADFVVMGVGVKPSLDLAQRADIAIDRGITVNEYLETSAPGVFAAGDVARWPDPHSGSRIRVEHWVVAQRQGQVAARNMLGRREQFDAVPFFWSRHYDISIRYVGHAERWDAVRIDGSLADQNASVTYVGGGRTLAVATVGRDRESLEAEVHMESVSQDRERQQPGVSR